MDKIAEYLIRKETITGKEFMKILRAVQHGLDIPENLDDLVLSEDEKEVSVKQPVLEAENLAADTEDKGSVAPEEKTESKSDSADAQAAEVKTEAKQPAEDSADTETEKQPGSEA